MEEREVLVIGGGLAGLSCAFELAERGRDVLLVEARDVVGGRTASWKEAGMPVESGLHRFLGYFVALPRLMRRCGVDVDQAVCWEDEVEIRLPDGGARGIFGLSSRRPVKTVFGMLANNDVLSPLDKASLVPFFVAGLRDYVRQPEALDRYSVEGYARRHRVRPRAVHNLLLPLTAGTFFLPPDRFSAFYFFGLLAPGIPRLHRMRLGAFMGGMTEVMTGPMAAAIEGRGGEVRTGVEVQELMVEGGRVVGARTAEEPIRAGQVVVATSLAPAQHLLREPFGAHPWFGPVLDLPTTPSATVQLELDAPSMDVDRTTFGPGTVLACFAEQCRTTFRHAPGRLSVILSPPERFLDMDPERLVQVVCADAERLGLAVSGHVTDQRVVAFSHDFNSLEPGHMTKRPTQVTPVPGLTLAGDYTRQRFIATMEGAVVSGQKAAEAVLERSA